LNPASGWNGSDGAQTAPFRPSGFPWHRIRQVKIDGVTTWVIAPIAISIPTAFFQPPNDPRPGPRMEGP